MSDFASLNLPPFVIERLKRLSLTCPTPIQAQAIPLVLAGNDLLASSQTGSGKTLAYLAPLITHLMADPQHKGLILLPTREIALQVKEVVEQLSGRVKEVLSVLLIGGESIQKQLMQLKKNPSLVIGTPGRICDHLNRKSLHLHKTSFFVLDEVDRMLDMGFSKPLEKICQALPQKRQTLMFSATLSPLAEKMAGQYLINPKRIAVTSPSQPAPSITQDVAHTSTEEKISLLLNQLHIEKGSVLVFVKTKRGAKNLALKLTKHNHLADAIHGDLKQNKRTQIMKNFRLKNFRIMVATDIAARGLDVPHINLVVNYDLPMCPEDYIHRIGRTGRAGAEGRALSLVAPHDASQWKAITRLMDPSKKPENSPEPSRRKKKLPPKGAHSQFSQKNFDGKNTRAGAKKKARPPQASRRKVKRAW